MPQACDHGAGKTALGCAQSFAADPVQVMAELSALLTVDRPSLLLLFCSSRFDLAALADHASAAFPSALVAGCTTAGEIGPTGYAHDSVTAVAFGAADFSVQSVLLSNLAGFNAADAARRLSAAAARLGPGGRFALTLFDGLCGREEPVISAIHAALGTMPVVGGSAGDDERFQNVRLIHHRELVRDAALVLLVATPRPFFAFKSDHIATRAERLVVTEADVEQRRVMEINGRPAATEYARLVGAVRADLCPAVYARHPLVVRVGGADFVRSIQRANADDSLTFYCAIDSGLVMKLGHSSDIVASLEDQFAQIRAGMGEVALILGFDCILRRLELVQNGEAEHVGRLLAEQKVVGFSTYGEQYRGMHINQTFCGVAIGGAP